jgi:hypothetical protein
MADTEDLVDALDKNREALERLLETTQDMFILQALEAGMAVHPVKALVGVSTDRVTRISKLRPRASSKPSN